MNPVRLATAVPLAGLLALAALAGSGCGSATQAQAPAPPAPVTLHYQIKPDGKPGPDGKLHDSFFALDPTTVKVGQKVTIEVVNYDGGQHSMTFNDLGLNWIIPGKDKASGTPGSFSTTLTLTRAGRFRWYCAIPCDGGSGRWAMGVSAAGMGQDDFMAGYLNAVN